MCALVLLLELKREVIILALRSWWQKRANLAQVHYLCFSIIAWSQMLFTELSQLFPGCFYRQLSQLSLGTGAKKKCVWFFISACHFNDLPLLRQLCKFVFFCVPRTQRFSLGLLLSLVLTLTWPFTVTGEQFSSSTRSLWLNTETSCLLHD